MNASHTPNEPLGWVERIGEYELDTEHPGSRPFRSLLRLESRDGVARLTGTEEYPDPRTGGVFRQPVTLEGDELLIGDPASEGGPSRYRIMQWTVSGFWGTWQTSQPAALRERQPNTPEWATGHFAARRRAAI
jgi:hypothetical protein